MKILIAEDDKDTALSYTRVLERRGHQVLLTNDGEKCLIAYHETFKKITAERDATEHIQPFDVVVIDYKMPQIDGIQVAKEILAVNQHQRIIFASAYVKETLLDSVKQLIRPVELLQKPFGQDTLVYAIEKKEIYSELQKLVHLQIVDLLEVYRKLGERNFIGEELENAELRHERIREILDHLGRQHNEKSKEEKGEEQNNNTF
ncbi:MAG TPA: response regulator [Candidatus Nitrosopolaris sp.]|nr:response regulator [Candidatus Nitrosopolaris sp.]